MTTPIVWFVKTKNGFSGPFTPTQLKGFAETGRLPRTAQVSKSPDGPWVVAHQIRGLFQASRDDATSEVEIGPTDLVPDAVKTTAVAVGNAMTDLSKSIVSSIRSAASNLTSKVESSSTLITNYCCDGQDPAVVEKMIARVQEICTSGEEILYVAMQSKPIANFTPDCVVLSSKRFIIYRPKMLGRTTFYDCLWKESKNVHMQENIFGAEISFESKSGDIERIDYLPKSQARKVYRIGQEMEEEAIALRRKMELESLQAGADKTVINQMISPASQASTDGVEDVVTRMAKLKSLLDNGLISQEEFQAKRNEILNSL